MRDGGAQDDPNVGVGLLSCSLHEREEQFDQ